MRTNEYKEHLCKQGISDAGINERIAAIQAFSEGLRTLGADVASAHKEAIGKYAKRLIAEGNNTPETFDALCEYTLWRGLRAQYIALVEISDCYNGMGVLGKAIEARHGAKVRDRIFMELPPPLGADEGERYAYTRQIAERMAELLTPEEARAAWFQVQHGIPESYWKKHDIREKEKYAGCETLGAFLQGKRQDRNAMLKTLHDKDELWFTMELTDEVLDFITSDVHMEIGKHGGKTGIVVTKVPYQAARFLRETDGKLKRYYACHCPLIREAIIRGEPIPAEVCYCSLGHASHFLAGMNLENLTGEVLQSVAQGDDRCRFIFYLPEEIA